MSTSSMFVQNGDVFSSGFKKAAPETKGFITQRGVELHIAAEFHNQCLKCQNLEIIS